MSRSRDRESSAVFQKSFFLIKAAPVAFYREELGEWCFSILFMKMNQTLRFTAFTVYTLQSHALVFFMDWI